MEKNQNDSDKENKNSVQIEECSTYPLNNEIIYKERVNGRTKRSFNYVIIKEGVYSNESITGPKNKKRKLSTSNNGINTKRRPTQQYKIPHGYVVETTWGQATKKRTVHCEIDYVDKIPQFQIMVPIFNMLFHQLYLHLLQH